MAQTLADKVMIAGAKAAAATAAKAAPPAGEVALARSVALGRYDNRLVAFCAALYGDSDATDQATVDGHVLTVLTTFVKLGIE